MNGLTLTQYPDPQGADGDTIPAAHAWIESLSLDAAVGSGLVTLRISRSRAAFVAGAEPVRRRDFVSGQGVLPPLTELLADPEFAAAYVTIAAKLYGHLAAAFPGATPAE